MAALTSGTLTGLAGGWAQLGQLRGTSAHGLFSMVVLGQLDFSHGGWLFPQSKHPKRTVTHLGNHRISVMPYSVWLKQRQPLPYAREKEKDLAAIFLVATV